MKHLTAIGLLSLLAVAPASAAIIVTTESIAATLDSGNFSLVPAISSTDWINGASSTPNANGATIVSSEAPELPQSVLTNLTNGQDAANNDDVNGVFFRNFGAPGFNIDINLGSIQQVSQINIYSRHNFNRAPQQFSIIGSNLSDFSVSTEIIPVSSFGLDDRNNAVSITDGTGVIGAYQHLRINVLPAPGGPFDGTFYTEIDVSVIPEPSVYALFAGLIALGALLYRRRR